MKTLKVIAALGAFLVVSSGAHAEDVTYKIDKTHTGVNFSVDHLVISTVDGRFDKFDGQFVIDEESKGLKSITGTVEAASINTNEPDRDKHLRSEDFFNVKKKGHEHLKFEAASIGLKPGSKGKVKGRLTINNVTKPVTFEANYRGLATDPWGNQKAGLEMNTTIKRADFGLTWNKALETGGVVVGKEVRIDLNLQGAKVEN